MTYKKREKIRAIVAFGDFEGYTKFLDDITNDETEFVPFDDAFDSIIEKIEKESDYYFSDTGDGFMCVIDLGSGHNCQIAIKVLHCLWNLLNAVRDLIRTKEHPKPALFRIVVATGYIFRKIKLDGRVSHRGRHINLAHKVLELARNQGIVVHEHVKAFISAKQARENGFVFRKLEVPHNLRHLIPHKDLDALYVFTVTRRHERLGRS